MLKVFLILLIAGTMAVLSVQNDIPLIVSFLIWKFETSFTTVAGAAMLSGVVVMQLVESLRAKREASTRNRLEVLTRRHRW